MANALAGAGGVASEDLGLQQRLEELLIAPALLTGRAEVSCKRSNTRGALSLERIPNRRAISRCVTPSAAIALT